MSYGTHLGHRAKNEQLGSGLRASSRKEVAWKLVRMAAAALRALRLLLGLRVMGDALSDGEGALAVVALVLVQSHRLPPGDAPALPELSPNEAG